MHVRHLTFLFCMLTFFSGGPALECPSSSLAKVVKSITANPTTTNNVEPGAANIIFQSKDGGQTWQDISHGLPDNEFMSHQKFAKSTDRRRPGKGIRNC